MRSQGPPKEKDNLRGIVRPVYRILTRGLDRPLILSSINIIAGALGKGPRLTLKNFNKNQLKKLIFLLTLRTLGSRIASVVTIENFGGFYNE
jgi:hypothetical protein